MERRNMVNVCCMNLIHSVYQLKPVVKTVGDCIFIGNNSGTFSLPQFGCNLS